MQNEREVQLRESLLDSHTQDLSIEVQKRPPRDSKRTKRPDSAWFVFDDLSLQQAEDLLRQHGNHASYLVSHFHDPKSYQLTIRFDDDQGSVFKHYSIGISGRQLVVEGIQGQYRCLEDAITAVQEKLDHKLVPIFYEYNCETCDYELSESADLPPDYKPAQRFPEAPRKPLPLIVPIRPTIRRLQLGSSRDRALRDNTQEESQSSVTEDQNHGCCWKTWHTDPQGKWYKPHKAGYLTSIVLVIGWIFFILLFGWIVLLALILVGILVSCAYLLNFICTGRCSIDDEDD